MRNPTNTSCACKKSKCIMLHCNCFSKKRGCTSKCKCSGCQNQPYEEKSQPLKGVTKKKNIPKLLENDDEFEDLSKYFDKIDHPNLSLPEGSKIIPKKRGRPPKKRLEEKENVSCGDNVNIKIEENYGHGAVHKVRGKRGNPRQFRNLMKELAKSVYVEDPDYVPVKRKYTPYMSLTPKTRKTTASSKRSRLADQTTVKKESPTEDSKIIEKGLKLSPFEVNSEFADAELQLQLGDDSSSIDKELYQELPVEEDMAKTHKDQSHLKIISIPGNMAAVSDGYLIEKEPNNYEECRKVSSFQVDAEYVGAAMQLQSHGNNSSVDDNLKDINTTQSNELNPEMWCNDLSDILDYYGAMALKDLDDMANDCGPFDFPVTTASKSDNTTETTVSDKTVNDECEIDDDLWNDIKELDDLQSRKYQCNSKRLFCVECNSFIHQQF